MSEQVASVARLIARAGLVQAFGHVSARTDGGGFALSSTAPLFAQQAADVLHLDAAGTVVAGAPGTCPLEAPMHAAVYAARPDVGAIVRTHSPHAAAWAARGTVPPLVHGLGGLAGRVTASASSDLVAGPAAGAAVARALGAGDCVLLRANGALCAGPDLPEAVVRAFYLEERAAVFDLAPDAPELEGDELRIRSQHFGAERARAWRWIHARYLERRA